MLGGLLMTEVFCGCYQGCWGLGSVQQNWPLKWWRINKRCGIINHTILSREQKGRQCVWARWRWTEPHWAGLSAVEGWAVQESLVSTLSLYSWSTQPFGLAVFSQQSFSSHSHTSFTLFCRRLFFCSSSHCGCSFNPRFFTLALARRLWWFPPCPAS